MRTTVVTCLMLLAGTLAQAQPADPMDAKGFQAGRSYLSELPFEHLDTLSGGLILTFTDLVLPGNAGRDLRFQRTYNSQALLDADFQWSFGIAGMVMRIHEQPAPPDGHFDVYGRDRMFGSAPMLETADGAMIHTVFVETPRTDLPSSLDAVISPQFWRYHREARILFMPDGTVCYYDAEGRLLSFHDPFDNLVELRWGTGVLEVEQHLGHGQSRVVTIVLDGPTGLPGSMTYGHRTWTYRCGERSWGQCNQLTRVVPPLGPAWEYEYNTTLARLGLVRTPQGGEVVYGWERVEFERKAPLDPAVVRTALTSRSTRDQGAETGRWDVAYTRWDEEPHDTPITAPSGRRLSFSYHRVTTDPETLDGEIALIGRGVQVRPPGGDYVALESEVFEYHAKVDVIVHGSRSWGTPEVRRRTVRRDGAEYVTAFDYGPSNFGDYHHPHLIVETGPTGVPGVVRTRTQTRTFRHMPAQASEPYIKALVDTDVLEVGGESFSSGFTYEDATGFLTRATRYGITTRFERDDRGNVARDITATGSTRSFEYAWGVVSGITTGAHTTMRQVAEDGTVRSESRGGRTRSFEYDDLFRLVRTQPPGGTNPIVVEYDDAMRTVTTSRGTSRTVTTLDGFGRPIDSVNAVGVRTTTRYDAEGRTIYESLPFVGPREGPTDVGVTTAFDGLGRVVRQTNADETYRERTYGAGTVTIRDENGRLTTQAWLAFGDPEAAVLAGVRDADNQVWTYTYNGVGQLTGVSAPDGTSRTWQYYAGSDRVQSETHPESGTTSYVYDAAGRLERRTDANDVAFTYTYDASDRLIREAGGGRIATIEYETGSNNRRLTWNGSASTGLLYDAAGRISERQDTVDGRVFRTRFEYDTNDQVAAISYPALHATAIRRRVQFARDAEGRLLAVSDATATYASGFEYHPSGALIRYVAGNGLETVLTYTDRRYWPLSIAAGPLGLEYQGYDGAGNVGTIADARAGRSQTFTYDALDRLRTATSDGGYPAITYAYDVHGNRQTIPGSTAYTYEPGTLRLASRDTETFQYDPNGNLRGATNATYSYTPHNMLESATVVGGTTTYAYDADDWRVKKATTGASTYYLRGLDQQVLTEWLNPGPSGRTRDYIYAGTRLVAAVTRSTSEDVTDLYGTIVPGGPPVSITFATPTQRAWLSFDGTAGQRVSLIGAATDVTAGSGGATLWNPLAIIRASDGTTLTTGGLDTGSKVFKDTVTLPETGAYVVLVDPYGTSVGTATVTLFDVVDAAGAVVIDDPAVSLPLGTPGQRGRLTFDAAGGQRVSLVARASNLQNQVSPTGTALWYPLAIERPANGGTLYRQTYTSTDALVEPIVLPDAGTYTVLVDPYQATTGAAAVSVHAVEDHAGTLEIDGPAVSADLTAPGQKARFSFTGAAGQRVSVAGTASGVTARWGFPALWSPLAIVTPDGTTLAAVTGDGNVLLEPVVLPVPGVYTVLVDPHATSTGTATVQAYDVADVTGSLSINGEALAVPLSKPGQNGLLTFAGTAGERVTVRLTGNTIGGTTVRLKRPDGTTMTTTSSSSTSFTLASQTLPTTGIYTVLVDPIGARTGTIGVAVTNP